MKQLLRSFAFLATACLITPAWSAGVRKHSPLPANGASGTIHVPELTFSGYGDEGAFDEIKSSYGDALRGRLSDLGYKISDSEKKANFVLTGTITDGECISALDETCGTEVQWVLADTTEEAVFSATTRHEETELDDLSERAAATRLLLGALDSLLSRKGFRDAVAEGANRSQSGSKYNPVVIKRCATTKLELPEMSQQALDATVLIKGKEGSGSAVFISPDGLLLTAAHVVDQPKLTANRMNGTSHEVDVLRVDKVRDVALLRLRDFKGISPCLRLREASASPGEDVYILGSPAGEELSFSISRGIVSGKRQFRGSSYLQTDASINPGNSGGPMVGKDGEILGIVSWKVAHQEFEGLGFSVPVSTAKRVLAFSFGDESETVGIEVKEKTDEDEDEIDEDPAFYFVGDDPEGQPSRWYIPVRIIGFAAAGAGFTTAALSYLAFKESVENANYQPNNYGGYSLLNTGGYIVGGIGVAMVASSIFLKEEYKLPGEVAVTPTVGLGSLGLKGTF